MYSDNRITKPLNRLKSFYQMEDEMRLSNIIAYAACVLAFFALTTPAIALMLADVGVWATGAQISPLQMMMDAMHLPVANDDNYSLVFP